MDKKKTPPKADPDNPNTVELSQEDVVKSLPAKPPPVPDPTLKQSAAELKKMIEKHKQKRP